MISEAVLNFLQNIDRPLAIVGFGLALLSALFRIGLDRIPSVHKKDAFKALKFLFILIFMIALLSGIVGSFVYLFPQIVDAIRLSNIGPTVRDWETSFEFFGHPNSEVTQQLIPTDSTFNIHVPLNPDFTAPDISRVAHTGRYSLNFIPSGNPVTPNNFPTAVSAALLVPIFDLRGSRGLSISYYMNSSSNPRPAATHNCDSALELVIRRDGGRWTHLIAHCGNYKSENSGWKQVSFFAPRQGASVMRVGFVYQLQNNPTPDPSAFFLIDDIQIVVVSDNP